MTKEDKKEFKIVYEKVRKLAREHREKDAYLDRLINKHYGFSFSDYDIEPIIDTLDYGTNSISFESFIDYMNEQKDELISNNFSDWDKNCEAEHAKNKGL